MSKEHTISALLDDIRNLELRMMTLEGQKIRKEIALAELMDTLFRKDTRPEPPPIETTPPPSPPQMGASSSSSYGQRELMDSTLTLSQMVTGVLPKLNGDAFKPCRLRDEVLAVYPEMKYRKQLVSRVASICANLAERGVLRKVEKGLYASCSQP